MRRFLSICLYLLLIISCTSPQKGSLSVSSDSLFNAFQGRFLDSFWRQNPNMAIFVGYGKYYESLPIPDSSSFRRSSLFSSRWIDSLHQFDYASLSNDNQINFRIIENRLRADKWNIDTFKIQEWDPSDYNLGNACYYILTQPYAPLDQRLRTLYAHLENVEKYYPAALHALSRPTKEFTELAIRQNRGSLEIFRSMIPDSIKSSSLSDREKDSLRARVAMAGQATQSYIDTLRKMMDEKKTSFRDFRIGKDLFTTKFRYDLVTDFTAEQMFSKALADKAVFQHEMFILSDSLWQKYWPGKIKPADSLELVKAVLDKIALQHATPSGVIGVASGMVHELEHFIIEKNLFDYDTAFPLHVRIMPAFMAGVALANAEFPPPYLQSGITYYNVSDLSRLPAAAAESELKEYNNYSLQLLSIHEAMPGHCLQGVYNHKNGTGMVKSVFENGAMVEGWAVYCEQMMIENGWDNQAPEARLILCKWRLRELGNVIIDYGLQCLGWSESQVKTFLKKETFQEDAQIDEKYHRATVSQVQLCSYYTGLTDILSLREDYEKKMGKDFKLKEFHENFLSYGSAPVKYIREMMLK